MNEVLIDIRKENQWITKHFENYDYVSIDQLLSCIEDLDRKIEKLTEERQDIEDVRDFYEKREKEILERVKEFW